MTPERLADLRRAAGNSRHPINSAHTFTMVHAVRDLLAHIDELQEQIEYFENVQIEAGERE